MGTFKFPWAVLGTPSCLALGHEIVGEAVAKGPDANIELGKKYIVRRSGLANSKSHL